MSKAEAKRSILSALSTLSSVLTDYAIVWPNAAADDTDQAFNKFAVVSVIWGKTTRADMGNATVSVRERTVGVVMIATYGEVNVGEGDQLALCDLAAALVRRKTVGTVTFRTPSIIGRGRVNDGRNWRIDVEAPFYVDVVI